MSFTGFKASLPNRSVYSERVKDFSIHSDLHTLGIDTGVYPYHVDLLSYTFDFEPVGAGSAVYDLFTIKHGYGFTPAAVCYVEVARLSNTFGKEAFYLMPMVSQIDLTSGDIKVFRAVADEENFYIQFKITDSGVLTPELGETVQFKYLIFNHPGMGE